MYDHLDLIALALIPGFMLIDLVHGSRAYQSPRLWRLNGSLVSAATVYLSFQIPRIWDALLDSVSLDAFGAYFPHPLDTFMFTSIGTLVSVNLLGLRIDNMETVR